MPRISKTKSHKMPVEQLAEPSLNSHIKSSPKNAAAVLLVLAGPAGSGKTTLCNRMVDEAPGFSRVITATTRAPRFAAL